mmetsp:Transcript_7150/g.15878  ORF Transcript_7150/g.15878 Transcript_7150/m.15878 type:complete len:1221 (-) Transcript_7150:140-3802(-)
MDKKENEAPDASDERAEDPVAAATLSEAKHEEDGNSGDSSDKTADSKEKDAAAATSPTAANNNSSDKTEGPASSASSSPPPHAAAAPPPPPILPQRSILRNPTHADPHQQQHPGATSAVVTPASSSMAAHKRYYDYPVPVEHHHLQHPQQQFPQYGYGGAYPPHAPYYGVPPGGGAGAAGGGPLPFRPHGYHPAHHPPYPYYLGPHHHPAVAPSSQSQSQSAGDAAQQQQSPRVTMGEGRGPPPPWLGGGAVSPLRPPQPRARYRPPPPRQQQEEEEGAMMFRRPRHLFADDRQHEEQGGEEQGAAATSAAASTAGRKRRAVDQEEQQQQEEEGSPTTATTPSNKRPPPRLSNRSTNTNTTNIAGSSTDDGKRRYDDALLLAEVSKIAEHEAHTHHRRTASASSSAEGASTKEDNVKEEGQDIGNGGIDGVGINQSPVTSDSKNDNNKSDDDSDKKRARDSFADNARAGAMASPIVRSVEPPKEEEEMQEQDRDQQQQQQRGDSPSSTLQRLEQPNLLAAATGSTTRPSPPRHPYGRYMHGGPAPTRPSYGEYGEYYPPASSSYPPRDSYRNQMISDSFASTSSYPPPRGGGGGGQQHPYSPGGPYPAGSHITYRLGGDGGGGRRGTGVPPIPLSSSFDRQDDQWLEHGRGGGSGGPSLLPPEYTPPAPHFSRHAPRRPGKHVEVTPNSLVDSPSASSHRMRSHSRDEDNVATTEEQEDQNDDQQQQDQEKQGESGPQPSAERHARFDETTERDQEDRDRRRAAAAAEAAGSSGGGTTAIPPFPAPRYGPSSHSAGRGHGGSGPKPYLPPPRPSAGSRFPYRDDETAKGGTGIVAATTPRESSKDGQYPLQSRSSPTPPPRESYYDGSSWSPYPLHQHRRIASGGFDSRGVPVLEFPGTGQGSTWGASASWDNDDNDHGNEAPASAGDGNPTAPAAAAPRTPRKGHRKGLPSVSMDYDDSPPGNVIFTPRSSFDPMHEGHRFLPPTPGGYYNDLPDYADFGGDYDYGAGHPQPRHHQPPHMQQRQHRPPPPPPHMMMPRPREAPFHPGSPVALAQRQFSTPSNSGSGKYPPLSAFQGSQPTGGGYYPGGEGYYAGKTVIRRKCPWKNFPELEDFLIENREEYLRHSAMNYTSQQRQYNNRLTERLLELAAQHGYVFDEEDFDFVTVRDRIRCYYKSYVQSKRKKGIKVGYAPERKKAKAGEGKQARTMGGSSEEIVSTEK